MRDRTLRLEHAKGPTPSYAIRVVEGLQCSTEQCLKYRRKGFFFNWIVSLEKLLLFPFFFFFLLAIFPFSPPFLFVYIYPLRLKEILS